MPRDLSHAKTSSTLTRHRKNIVAPSSAEYLICHKISIDMSICREIEREFKNEIIILSKKWARSLEIGDLNFEFFESVAYIRLKYLRFCCTLLTSLFLCYVGDIHKHN